MVFTLTKAESGNKKNNKNTKKDEEFSYGYLLQVLAGGLYPNKMHVLRECIQNSYDSLKEFSSIKRDLPIEPIHIFIKNSSIFVHDSGMGMNEQKLHEFRKIGFSTKNPEESVGFQGIGKLAGISVAKKLIVTTSMYNDSQKHTLVFDAEGALEELKKWKKEGKNPTLNHLVKSYTTIKSFPEDKEKHYTFLELKDIRDDAIDILNEAEVMGYIARNCPVLFDPQFKYAKQIDERLKLFVPDYWNVSIKVNGKEIFKPYLSNLNQPEFLEVKIVEEDKSIAF